MSGDELPGRLVLAVRVAPGHYLVEAGRLEKGDRFTVDGRTFELVGDQTPVATLTVLVKVREVEGPEVGREFTARLQGGTRQT
ncbi:hypothetical protein GCM10022237_39740 [Nocardioides ginsengisoli]